MQPIGDYLKKLLYQYDCIVVPTLGAFLTHAVSASFSEVTGQFLPPRRKVAFNEALMLDDGILLNYVMLHEGISREEALKGINLFVGTLKQQARQMGSFSIEGLGLFSYNQENSLQFEPELRHNFLGNAYGMQPVMLPGKIIHLAQPVPVINQLQPSVMDGRQLPVVAQAASTDLAIVSDAEEGVVMAMPMRRSGFVWRWAAAALLVGSLGFISYFSVIRPGDPLQSSLNPASLFRVPTFSSNESASKVPATGAPINEPAVTAPPAVEVVRPAADSKPAESVATGRASVRLSVVEPANVPASTVTYVQPQAKTNFTVIAGSFASRINAVRFKKRLVKAGYSDAYILQGKGLIKVAAIGTQSLAEAEAGIDSLNSLTGIAPWIMRN
ncbi:SPOR domain-containing protein [Fibrella arboris]|uniref:HU domain-containing protein n=1 Tax=Fibrella arboris TaxID=3242486 RepID=UPI0035209378